MISKHRAQHRGDHPSGTTRPDARTTVRVLLVDDDALVRSALRTILTSVEDIDVVGEASDGDEAAPQVQRHRPDLVLMDVRMPRMDGLRATLAVTALVPAPRVVILTKFDMEEHVFAALEAGASGFLLKDTPPRELIDAVRAVSVGGTVLSPQVTRCLVEHVTSKDLNGRRTRARARIAQLSRREIEVLVAVSRGLSNAEIGLELHVSEATVKAHVSRILVKLDAANRVQMAVIALEADLR